LAEKGSRFVFEKGLKEGIFGETFAEDQVDACQVLSCFRYFFHSVLVEYPVEISRKK